MATIFQLGSPLLYNYTTLTKTHLQRTPKRCVPRRFRRAAVAETSAGQDVVVQRRSANYERSVWDHDFLLSLENKYAKESKAEERAKGLKEDVRKMLVETEWGYRKQLELIDNVQRLGISYHFEHEIDHILTKIYNEHDGKSRTNQDLNATALEFRLLRQHGFDVSQDVFDKFKDENGAFRRDVREDSQGLLSLYEASYLSTKFDTKLKEARSFARDELREFVAEKGKESYIEWMVVRALEMPFHWSVRAVEARWYMDVYGKRQDMVPALLDFARLDFNISQAIHQQDVKDASRWWRDTGMGKQLEFARDRITESYFWGMGLSYEPHFGFPRQVYTILLAVSPVIDDIYDVYGTLEELQLFTTAVEKWNVNCIEELPEYMKLSFLVLYNETIRIGRDVYRDTRLNVLPCLRKSWADLCKSFMVEAKWYKSGYKPSLEEYLENAWVSISGPLILVHAFCILCGQISQQSFDAMFANSYSIIRAASIILRLTNDLATSSAEMARGDVPKSIQCYMRDTGASEAEARAHLKRLISHTWDQLNHHIQLSARTASLPPRFAKTSANLARMGLCIYQHGDGHGRPDEALTVHRLLSLIVHPVPLVDLP